MIATDVQSDQISHANTICVKLWKNLTTKRKKKHGSKSLFQPQKKFDSSVHDNIK